VATMTWSNVLENNGFILGIDSEAVFLLTMVGLSKKSALQKIQTQLVEGAAPTEVGAAEVVSIPFSNLRRIQVSELWQTVDFRYADATNNDKERHTTFQTEGPFEYCQSIAREVASAAQRTSNESFADASVLSVLLMPGIFAAIIAIFVGVLYTTAAELEAGTQVVAQGRKAGMKQLLIWLSSILGTKMTLAIGGLCFAAVIFWAFKRIAKRPQILTLDFANNVTS
jgi:hypothetical protein